MMLNSQVTSIDVPFSEVIKRGSVVCLTDFNVKRSIIKDADSLRYKVSISPIK
jgi:hypothetical protein